MDRNAEGHDIAELKRVKEKLESVIASLQAREEELEAANEELLAQEQALLETNRELEETNEKLRLSERSLGMALDIAQSTIWEMDLVTGTVSIKRYPSQWKYADPANELPKTSEEFAAQFHPDSRPVVQKVLDDYVNGRTEHCRTEARFRGKDGEWQWILLSAEATKRNETGKPLKLMGTSINITAAKKAEADLKLDEMRLEALVTLHQKTDLSLQEIAKYTMEEAIRLTASRVGYIASVNDEETELNMHAWSESAIRQCSIKESQTVFPVESTGLWGEAIRQRKAIITNNYAAPNPWKKGYPEGHIPLIRHLNVPIFDGDRIVLVTGVGNKDTDYDASDVRQLTLLMTGMWSILQRRRAEEGLARLAAATEQTTEIVVITDKDGMVQYVNPAFEATTGYSKGEIFGQPYLALIGEQNHPEVSARLRRCFATGEVWSETIFLKKKSGNSYEAKGTLSPIRDETGKMINFVYVNRDISHEKRLEKQLRQAQKMEAIGTLAGGIAHDFNNILSAVYGYTELSLTLAGDLPHLKEYLEQVLKAAERAKELIRQILAISRQGEIIPRPIFITPIVKEVLKFIRASLPSTIEIRQNLEAERDLILADPTQIYQVLMNLCVNAGQAMKESGGILAVALRNDRFDTEELFAHPDRKNDRCLVLSVKDSGCGIPKHHLDRIFEPYFTTKRSGEGTGLGLAVVQAIVLGCRGIIRVNSEEGTGTVFHVCLPLADRDETEKSAQIQAIPRGTERILVVDDEPSIVDMASAVLEGLGYSVKGRNSPREALELFRESPQSFNLVITDKTMPEMTGIGFFRELRKIRTDIPVLLCTGFSESREQEQARQIGVNGFVLKPISRQELATAVRHVLDAGKI